MDYEAEAGTILGKIKRGERISAIKRARTVTFCDLKYGKRIVDCISMRRDDLSREALAGYLMIHRLTSEACMGKMRTYDLGDSHEYDSAVDHLGIIFSYDRARGIIDGVSRVCDGLPVSITLNSSVRYDLHT